MITPRHHTGRSRAGRSLAAAILCGVLGVAVQVDADEPEAVPSLQVTAGRSLLLTTDYDVTRIAITDPDVADALVVQAREVLIHGKTPGTISFIVWGAHQRTQYDLVVQAPVPGLQQHLQQLFPGEDIRVNVSGDAVVLSGNVSNNAVMLRVEDIARATGAPNVINMLQLPGGTGSEQVILQVRFAEVNRRALTDLGLGLFVARERFLARSTTQQYPAPDFERQGDVDELVFSDFLNLFFFDRQEGIGGVLKALQQRGAFQSLAEPNLIAYNGKEASFLAGGEFPIPVVQGTTGAVTVQFREFGVRLSFLPTIAGDVIRLQVAPEVSALDYANGVTIGGFRIPALTTRRAETEVELRDGQSFAIAGLLDNVAQSDAAAIPVLGRLPIIGPLFRSRAERADRTELMVLVTPRLVRPLDPDEVPPLPTEPDLFLPRESPGERRGGTVDAPGGNQ